MEQRERQKPFINEKGVVKLRGVPLFRCIVHELVDKCIKETAYRYNMEAESNIREALYYAYLLGKRTTRAYYNGKRTTKR